MCSDPLTSRSSFHNTSAYLTPLLLLTCLPSESVSRFSSFSAFASSFVIVVGGGWPFIKTPTILDLISHTTSLLPTFFSPCSTPATICATGILLGASAKLRPLSRSDFCVGVKILDDKFTTHRMLSLLHPLGETISL